MAGVSDELDALAVAMIATCAGNVIGPSPSAFLAVAARTVERAHGCIPLWPDAAAAGYLRGEIKGFPIYVPFNLVGGLVPEPLLGELIELGQSVCVAETSRLCVSGSSTFLGDLKEIGDIDYCEYAVLDASGLAKGLKRLAARAERPHLVEVKIDKTKLHHPWGDLPGMATSLMAAPTGAMVTKLDFVGVCPPFGPLPVSNLVLPISADAPDDGNAQLSHPFQEVVLVRGENHRPDLASAGRLQAYASFLRQQLKTYIEDDPIKAIKRGLSLLRLLGVTAFTTQAVAMINHPSSAAIVRRKRMQELAQLAAVAPPEVANWLKEQLGAPASDLDQAIEDGIRVFAKDLLAYVNELFAPHEAGSPV